MNSFKIKHLLILIVFFIVTIFNSKILASPIQWETSILKAMERAKNEDKPIFVELYAHWCKTCKKLEQTLLKDKEVLEALKPFVLVRLNGEEYPNFMRRYNSKGFPTLLFLDKYTNYISKIQGLPNKSFLIQEAKTALSNANTEVRLKNQLNSNPNSIQAHFELGIYYYQKEDYKKSSSYFQIVRSIPPKTKAEKELVQQAIYNLALLEMNQGKYKEATLLWDEYISQYNDSSLSGAYLHRGIAWRELGDPSKAKKDFEKAKSISIYPEELEIIQEELNSLDTP